MTSYCSWHLWEFLPSPLPHPKKLKPNQQKKQNTNTPTHPALPPPQKKTPPKKPKPPNPWKNGTRAA